ncbi:hypothetical protein [Pimelobacter simplex]|uniref:hypothetical protein n=1 Tax=Nocardioides simplex TaxID=2045 RepID=UPI00214F66A5|nr:hypothetical protein [Pimelobacter simplex]UUW88352.1 hypothetical protein M0M43_21770 [Pimelobacter simplex]UUW97856.1 hypothetical protein M0M48_10415 [Pimelobacter simplex]
MSAPIPALRVLAAVANGAVLVGRPHGVVHVHHGDLTRSGRAVPAACRPVCGIRSRRLRVFIDATQVGRLVGFTTTTGDDLTILTRGGARRLCRTCTAMLPARLGGGSGALVSREDWLSAYGDLTTADLLVSAAWARTVDETHQVQFVAQMLFGSRHQAPEVHTAIEDRRKVLVAATRTSEEVAANRAYRVAEDHNRRLIATARRHQDLVERAQRKRRHGRYLMPHEREALATG